MKRSTTTALLCLVLPIGGCAEPDPGPSDSPFFEPAREDRRPAAGRDARGDDITELVRAQNAPGSEPPLPTRKGVVTQASYRPSIRKTRSGYVAELPSGRNMPTPAHHRGKVLMGAYGTHEFHALDARTGRSRWSVHLSDDGPTDPACKEGICVFNTYSCTLFSVDAETGRHLWSWYLGSPQLATPVVYGDIVYSSYPERSGPPEAQFALAAFDLRTGAALWRRWLDAEVSGAPVAHRGRIFVATRRGTLYELGAADGDVRSVRRNQIASPPVLTADTVLFGRGEEPPENDMLATSEAVFPELEPSRPASEMPFKPRPLVAEHRLITVDGGVVLATDRTTGRRLWRHRFDGDAPARVTAPLLQAGPSILLATEGGNVLRIDPDSGEVTSTFPLGAGQLASQPIAVDGWIYAGTRSGAMVAFDTGDGALTGWEMFGGGPDRRGTLNPEGT
jgi:outer membrane protein assembly factor BamB